MVRTRITNNGVVEQAGSGGLSIETAAGFRGATFPGVSPFSIAKNTTSTPESGAFTVTDPGFYWVSGSFETTGTLPSAATHPGGVVALATAVDAMNEFMLTGSNATNADAVFAANGLATGSMLYPTVLRGSRLTVEASGSIMLRSDGRFWIPTVSSGSITLQV